MKTTDKLKMGGTKLVRSAMAGVLAVGLMPLPAFAVDYRVTAAPLSTQATAMDPSGYVIAAAYAAAEPAPELLGLNNPNYRNAGEADNIAVMFGSDDVNESPDPYVYNYKNDLTPGIVIGGRTGRGPMAGLDAYDTSNATAAQNTMWAMLPHIILGTGADDIPENEHDFYRTDQYARAVETALGQEAGSYNPIGVTYNRVSLPTMIQTMYRLATAANEVTDADSSLKTRYEDPIEIAKDYERYIVGQKGIVLQAINSGQVPKRTIALVESYDSTAGTYTIITDGVSEGTATTNRYLEAVQGVATNYYDVAGATVTAAQLAANVDTLIVGGNAGDDAASLAEYLGKDNLLDRTFYCTNWSNGSVFGTTVNSVENAQNVGRILPCVYPELLDQSDMIAYYYDTFYHIKDGKIASMIDERMDGVRNWNQTDSTAYTAWGESDVTGYVRADVEDMLKMGIAFLNTQSGLSSYLTPSTYLKDDASSKKLQTVTIAAKDADFTKTFGDAGFELGATTDGGGAISYASSNPAVATVSDTGQVAITGAGKAIISATAAANGDYARGVKSIALTVKGVDQEISASDVSVAMGATANIGAKVTKGTGALSYKSSNEAVAQVSGTGIVTPVKVGTADITITAAENGNYSKTEKAVKVTVTAGKQALKFNKQTKKVKLAKVKKAKQAVAITKATGAKTNVTYSITKYAGNAKKFVTGIDKKSGKITVKKGAPKGSYKVTVTATAAKSANWAKATKAAVITVKVG